MSGVFDIALEHPELAVMLDGIAARYNSAAVSLVVFNGGSGEYFTYQYGYANIAARQAVDADTKFRVASLAKLTTAICAMVLVDEGLLDLDADISIYLGYQVRNPHSPAVPITARMLLQHTSSIFDSDAFLASRNANSSRSTQHLLDAGSSYRRREPGSRHEYTNFGYAVLGAVCEKISGKSLDTLARDVLFDPLGIDAAYVPANLSDTENIAAVYDERHTLTRSVQQQLRVGESDVLGHDHHLAQGNLTISSLDFARVLAMLGNGGLAGGHRILSQASVSAMHETDVAAAAYRQGLAVRYQYEAFMPGKGSYWHTGSMTGTFAQFIYCTQDALGVVVVTTGATTGRAPNGMVAVCTELSAAAWMILNG